MAVVKTTQGSGTKQICMSPSSKRFGEREKERERAADSEAATGIRESANGTFDGC
jgi:hypothetical protein